jgi:uncharacterized protein YggE
MYKLAQLALLTVAVPVLYAQVEHPRFEPNTVQANAQGKFEAEPDTAVLTFTLSDKEATQDAAYKNVSAAAEQFRTVLRQNNVDPKHARIASYSISPEYDWHNPKRKPIAYNVQTTAELKLTDFAAANKLLSQLSDLQYASNQSLFYSLENIEAAKQKAIADAFKNARAYAEGIASSSQRHIGELLYASVDTPPVIRPFPAMSRMGTAAKAEAPPPAPTEDLGQQTQTITAQVTAIFRMQ